MARFPKAEAEIAALLLAPMTCRDVLLLARRATRVAAGRQFYKPAA